MYQGVPPARVIPLEGGLNFRDLGGYHAADGQTTRWRTLFRSGSTHLISAADRLRLTELGIRAAVDLRSNTERAEHPHGLLGQPDILYWSHDHDHFSGRLLQMLLTPHISAGDLRGAMLKMYREMPFSFSEIFRQLFRTVSSGPLPVVFNCAAGKDRTGVAAALLLSALGVEWEDVIADYSLSETEVPAIQQLLRLSEAGKMISLVDPDIAAPLFLVDRAYLDAARDGIMARSGSMENFFKGHLQIEESQLRELRKRLLE